MSAPHSLPGVPALPIAEFAFPGPLRDQLVAAILDGSKTSTTTTRIEYEIEQEDLPVIETTEVRQARLADVDLQHVIDEGEDDTIVAQWRAGHEQFWHSAEMRNAMGDPDFTVTDDSILVLQRFKAITRLP